MNGLIDFIYPREISNSSIIPSNPNGLYNNTQVVPEKSAHGDVNPKYSKFVDEIFSEYPGLKTFSNPSDYMVMDAKGDMLNILKKNNFGLEFQNKGETDYLINKDKLKLDNPDKYRIYLNPNLVSEDKAKEAIKLDMLSHAFRNNKDYLSFVNDLRDRLYKKYGKEMVEGNDGVDGYIRGYLSNSKEYEPYKKELSFLPAGYFDRLDKILKNKTK